MLTCWIWGRGGQLWRWTCFGRIKTPQRLVSGWLQLFGIVTGTTRVQLDISFTAAAIRSLLNWIDVKIGCSDRQYFRCLTHIATHIAALLLEIAPAAISRSSRRRRRHCTTTAARNRNRTLRQFSTWVCWHCRNAQYTCIAHTIATGHRWLRHQA